jgi:hypothetical protein
MQKRTLKIFAVTLALIAGLIGRAQAQTVDKAYAKSITLASGGTSTANTLTLTPSASQGTALTITLPSVNAIGPLTNDGNGNLSWNGPTGVAASTTGNQYLTTNATPAVQWQGLNLTATLQGNGVGSSVGIALNNANTWTGLPTMLQNNIGSNSTDGLALTNATAATSSTQQASPRFHLSGRGWGGSSQSVDWIMQTIPVAGTTNPTAYLDFQNSVNGGSYSTHGFDIFSSGGASLGIASPTDPGAGVFNLGTGVQIGGSASSGKMLIGNGTNYVPTTITFPTTAGTAGNIIWSNGTSFFSDSVTTQEYAIGTNPTGTTSSTGVMMGLGATATITPHGSGVVLIIVTGNMANTVLSGGDQAQIYYGTGTAPSNGNAITGTAAGSKIATVMANNENQWYFSLNAIVGGGGTPLTVGTKYWIDVSLAETGSSTASINNVTISAVELE